MTAKINKSTKHFLKQFALGLVSVFLVGIFAFYGSATKRAGTHSTLVTGNTTNYNISVDEVSALYVMAGVATSAGLPSENAILASYYNAKTQYATNQYSASLGKIEKPVITNVTSHSSGVIPYVVEEGDSMDSIIAYLRIPGLSTDQIRWSNGMKDTSISEGSTLYIPNVAGIAYVTKAGDTADSLASKYGSDAYNICSANHLEDSGCALAEGLRIVLPGGELPENERPEYVPPAPVVYHYVSSYAGNGYVAGQCTWYAWNWRHEHGSDVPSNLGNAYSWANNARAAGYAVDGSPNYGAVFVDVYGGYGYGHVGIVTGVNGDGTLIVSDMNYAGPFIITNRTVPASTWQRWQFIH